jgi:Nif-specific regulatory protein
MTENHDLDRLQATLDELKCINRVVDRISRVREINHIMSIIIEELVAITGATQGVINLLPSDKDSEPLTVIRKNQAQANKFPFKVGSFVTGWVLKNNTILKIDDLDTDKRFSGLTSEEGRFKSILCCPMVARGEIVGLTSLIRDSVRGPFSDDQSRLAGIVVSQSAQILSNAMLLEELARKNELLEVSQKKIHEENARLKGQIEAPFVFENIIGKSEILKQVMTLASKVSGNDSPLLITGQTGTGKELIARAIHYNSRRKSRPFVVKNCGIKTESLLEAELFGYVKGAFTGADRDKIGLFREANGGTIFLDEIGEAPLTTQVAILRVLENGEIRPVGANKTEYVDVRIISATNRNLQEEIKKGNFREDLFYRLNTFVIELPPLNRRREDIPLLVHHLLKKLQIKLGNPELSITPAALELLGKYSWPGNIRQLENELERAAVISSAVSIIDVSDLSPEIYGAVSAGVDLSESHGQLKDIVEKVEKDIITATLTKNKGNILRTSKILGLTRKGLKDKMSRYGITADNE